MDPNADDITLLEFLKRDLRLFKDRAGDRALIALNSLPKDLLRPLKEAISDKAFSRINGQQYVSFADYAEFSQRQIAQTMQRMQLRSLELGMTGPALPDLDDAPTLSHWVAILDPEYSGTILIGEPIGHPTCKGPLSHTSRLCALDQAGHWARTTTRWYRLAKSETGIGFLKRNGDRVAGISGLALKRWQVQRGIAKDRISAGLRNDH